MIRKSIGLASLWIMIAATAWPAAPDFYGVKMRSESFADDLEWDTNSSKPAFVTESRGLDKNIYAYGTWENYLGSQAGLRVEVFNQSKEPIATTPRFRDYIVVTKDGERHDLSETAMEWNIESIAPNTSASFSASLAGRKIKKEDIRLIIFSFELGKTKIVLLPLPQKAAAVQAAAPTPIQPPVYVPSDVKTAPAKKEPVKPVEKIEEKAKPAAETAKTESPSYKKQNTNVIPKDERHFFKGSKIKHFGVEEKKEEEKAPAPVSRPAVPRSSARVTEVHLKEGFVVIDVGLQDGIKENTSVNILRDGRAIARGVIKQVRRGVSAATILPEWTKQEVRAGDAISFYVVNESNDVLTQENGAKAPVKISNEYPPRIPRTSARVTEARMKDGFILVDVGTQDGLQKDTPIRVLRDGRVIGRAVVKEARENAAGATVLPEWTREEIRAGDQITLG